MDAATDQERFGLEASATVSVWFSCAAVGTDTDSFSLSTFTTDDDLSDNTTSATVVA